MRFPLYCLIALGLMASCKNSENRISEENPTAINLNVNSPHSSLADAIQITRVINLETTDSSTISSDYNIKRIILNTGKLYVMDAKFMSIKVFDENGKFLHNIGSLGRGRGQFTNLQSIAYYAPHQSIWALCNTPRKIIEFSLDGKIIKELNIPFFASDLGFEGKNKIYFFVNQNANEASQDKNILITDSSLNIQERIFKMPQRRKGGVLFAGGIYTIGEKLYYNPPLTRTIYALRDDSAKALYKIDFGKGNAPDDFIDDSLGYYMQNRNLLTQGFIKTDNYLGFCYLNKGHNLAFFNKNAKSILTTDVNLNQLNKLFNNAIFQSDGQLMIICNVNNFADILRTDKELIQKKYPLLYEKIILVKSHDNPSIIFFNLK